MLGGAVVVVGFAKVFRHEREEGAVSDIVLGGEVHVQGGKDHDDEIGRLPLVCGRVLYFF